MSLWLLIWIYNYGHYTRRANTLFHSIAENEPSASFMISYWLRVSHSFFQINVTQWDFHQPVSPLLSLSLSLSLSHTVSLSLCLSLALSPPDVRYSGRVCAAGCRLTLFKTMITSFRLVLQLSTPGAPTAGTPTDHSTHTQTTTTHTHTHTHTHARTHMHAMQYGLKKQPQGWVIKQKTMTLYITFHKVSH